MQKDIGRLMEMVKEKLVEEKEETDNHNFPECQNYVDQKKRISERRL